MQRTSSPRLWLLSSLLLAPASLALASCDIGIIGRECTVTNADACSDREYCAFDVADACGDAGQSGTCEAIPQQCTQEYAPVCGCDGVTYGNACAAAAAGVSVSAVGECDGPPPNGDVCGGIQGLPCDAGEYCDYGDDATCNGADLQGTCVPIPQACDAIYAPVCSCDGVTYGNECEAAAAGVSIFTPGECGSDPPNDECGGLQGLACDDGEYCNFPPDAQCGAADQTGTCAPRPEVCNDVYDPVCGCDDRTYGNACEAAAAGVSVASEGPCEPTAEGACGGLQGLACDDGEYCNFPPDAQCGAADQLGRCTPIPEACTLEYNPVCGCDGVTYGNRCAAALAGVSVASSGECDSGDGGSCGSRGLPECGKDEYCNFPPDAQCGDADAPGTCEPRPEACDAVYDPVCGCDGQTYGNACEAAAAGVSVASEGTCEGEGGSCGGIAGLTCDDGEYCDYGPEATCEGADLAGTCRPTPQACTREYDPVCSCDGVTYGNACEAAANGVSIFTPGACAGETTACGGLLGLTCDPDAVCVYERAAVCGAADQPGTCVPVGTCERSEPVCGCDGVTYRSLCEAAEAGATVGDATGPC